MIEFDESDMAKTYRGRATHARAAAQDMNIGDLKVVLERLADQYEAKAVAYERARSAAMRAGDARAPMRRNSEVPRRGEPSPTIP